MKKVLISIVLLMSTLGFIPRGEAKPWRRAAKAVGRFFAHQRWDEFTKAFVQTGQWQLTSNGKKVALCVPLNLGYVEPIVSCMIDKGAAPIPNVYNGVKTYVLLWWNYSTREAVYYLPEIHPYQVDPVTGLRSVPYNNYDNYYLRY